MSSISSVGSSASCPPGVSQTKGHGKRGGPKELEDDLASFLQTQGVSASDQQQVIKDVKSAIEATSSNEARPDPSKIQDAIAGVLKDHGIDGADFLKNLPSGPPPGGESPPPRRTSGSSDSNQLFLDFLTREIEKLQSKSSESSNANEAARSNTATGNLLAASATFSNDDGDGDSDASVQNASVQNASGLNSLLAAEDDNSPYSSLLKLIGASSTFSAEA